MEIQVVNYFGGRGDGVIASLETRQQFTQVVNGGPQRRHVLQNGQDVSGGVQHPTLVESLQRGGQEHVQTRTSRNFPLTDSQTTTDLSLGGRRRHLAHVLLVFGVRGVLCQLVEDVCARWVRDVQIVSQGCAVGGGTGERVFLVGLL